MGSVWHRQRGTVARRPIESLIGHDDPRRVAGLIGAIVLVCATVVWVSSERAIHPPRFQAPHRLADYDLPVEHVRFLSRDGTPLAGWFIKGARPETILVVHGFGASKEAMLPHLATLNTSGFNAFALDLRNSGDSGGATTTFGYQERYDVAAAADYLMTRADIDKDRIGVLGVSMGAAAAILGAAETHTIKAILAEDAYGSIDSLVEEGFEDFLNLPKFPFAPLTVRLAELRAQIDARQIRPLDAVSALGPRPLMFIANVGAPLFRYQDSIALSEAARGPRYLWLIEGGGHGGGLYTTEDYARRVTAFFDAALNDNQT